MSFLAFLQSDRHAHGERARGAGQNMFETGFEQIPKEGWRGGDTGEEEELTRALPVCLSICTAGRAARRPAQFECDIAILSVAC